ncbi:1551_t:CDS:1, partial [Ambispora leptoticha]
MALEITILIMIFYQVAINEIDKEIAHLQALKKCNTKNLPKKHNLS